MEQNSTSSRISWKYRNFLSYSCNFFSKAEIIYHNEFLNNQNGSTLLDPLGWPGNRERWSLIGRYLSRPSALKTPTSRDTCLEFIGIKGLKGSYAESEVPIFWPPDVKSQLIGKDPDAGKNWRQEEKGMTEDANVGWHHWFNGHEFEQSPGDGEGQGGLACCSPWGLKESDTTERLNNNKAIKKLYVWLMDLDRAKP